MSYRLDLEKFKERIGTFEKPHLLAITNGKDHGSVIVHVKYDDGSTYMYGKYLRYCKNAIRKTTVHYICCHYKNRRTEKMVSGKIHKCRSRITLKPKVGNEWVIKTSDPKERKIKRYTIADEHAFDVALWEIVPDKNRYPHAAFCLDQRDPTNYEYDFSKTHRELWQEKKKYTTNGRLATKPH